MRAFLIVSALALAACSDEDAAPKPEAAAVDRIDAGRWQADIAVTQFAHLDKGKARIDTPMGTRTSASSCVAEAERARPAPAFFTGPGDACVYKDFYMAGGMLNATLSCTRPGLQGAVMRTASGTFTATGFEGTLDTQTYLVTDGDVKISAKLSAKRTGACAP